MLEQDLYRRMILIRCAEERIAAIYEKGEMRCPVHLGTGQEAAPVAVCAALQEEDWVFSSHRNHGWYLAKGGDINTFFAELFGKDAGCSRGRGGSMHLVDTEHGFSVTSAIVGGTVPHAVGAAQAFKMRGENRIAVAHGGDAIAEEGVFFESLNYAQLFSLPVLFCIENNGLSVESKLNDRRTFDLESVVKGFSMKYVYSDSLDVVALHQLAEEICNYVRRGKPAVLEIKVNRFREHVHPPGWTKIIDEQDRKKLDPILRFEDLNWIKNCYKEAEEIVDKALEFARKSKYPSKELLLDYVYE